MKRTRWMMAVAALLMSVPVAHAQDEAEEVVDRLKRHGGMNGGAANRLVKQVSKAMNRSADLTNSPNDPLRVRVSRALTGTPQPGDAMAVAKVRLRLYAGLTTWALDSLFRPEAGAIAACTRDFKLPTKDCTALLAAGGQISSSEVAAAAGGEATSSAVAAAPAAPASAAPPPSGSRFGRFNSGYGSAAGQPATPAQTAAPVARPTAAAAAPGTMSTKDAYAARRAAYLEKQRAKMNKPAAGAPVAAAAAAEPAEETEAEPVAVAAASAPEAAKPAASAKAAEPAAAPAAAPAASKPQLDGDFLDGLLDDPLGKK